MNLINLYKDASKEYEKGALGYSAIAIIFQSGLGSVAVMLINMNGNTVFNVVQFMLVAILCMLYNATVLSQQKPSLAFKFLLISISVSLLLIIFNLIIMN